MATDWRVASLCGSTLAMMGYATVVSCDTVLDRSGHASSCSVVSVYALVAALVAPPGWVEAMGEMNQHKFTLSTAMSTLRSGKKYRHTRGVCVV